MIEIAENWLQRFRMEGAVRKRLTSEGMATPNIECTAVAAIQLRMRMQMQILTRPDK